VSRKTPIVLITGSLGSGKTTLVRQILQGTPHRLAVLMNEFGEVAIDSKIIQGANIDIIELAGGCVCCSMTGELEAAVREIIENIRPDFILVEATGVAESDALVYEVEDNLPEVRLEGVVCIVDAYLSIRHPSVGYTARTQIASSDIILINKVDLVAEEEVGIVEEQVRKYNDRAALARTIGCSVDHELLFGVTSTSRPRSPRSSGGTDFQSFTWSTGKLLDSEKFEDLVTNLPEQVFRAKGFVRVQNGSVLFNYVAGRVDFEEFSSEETELVFIGPDLNLVREGIRARLKECEVE
jgi:G3E family GTPase